MSGRPQERGHWGILAIRSASALRVECGCEPGEGFLLAEPDQQDPARRVRGSHLVASAAARCREPSSDGLLSSDD